MGKTEMVNGFKLAGPLADARHVVIYALHLIDEAEKLGTPISRGDLVEVACHAFYVAESGYSWLGSPGPKSPIDKLYTREKQGKVYVMKMMEEGRQLLGKGMNYEELRTAQMHNTWEKEGVFDYIKKGELYKLHTPGGGKYETVVVVDPRAPMGISVIMGDGSLSEHNHVIYFHHIDCDAACVPMACRGDRLVLDCVRKQRKKVAA